MKRRCAIGNLVLAAAVSLLPLLCVAPLFCFAISQSQQPDFTIHSDVRLVLLDVGVKDRRGSNVPGLSKEAFKILEDGRPQPIQVFASKDVPATVGLIDRKS